MGRQFWTVVVGLFLACAPGVSSETDNFAMEGFDASIDVVDHLDAYFDEGISRVVSGWRKKDGETPRERNIRLARDVFHEINGATPNTNGIKAWYNRSGLPGFEAQNGIYEDLPEPFKFGFRFKPPVYVVYADGVPIGMDKLGHFFCAGWMVFGMEYIKNKPGSGIRWAAESENGLLGYRFGGIFSNGDLVADYEGYLFFLSLFETIDGMPPIVGWNADGSPFIQRKVDLSMHINSFWNEAMNPSVYRPFLQKVIEAAKLRHCRLLVDHPEWFIPVEEELLLNRYRDIGLKYSPGLRLDRLCPSANNN